MASRVEDGAALLDVDIEDVEDKEVEELVFVNGGEEFGLLEEEDEEEEERVVVLRVLPVEEDEPGRRLVLEAKVSVARMLLSLAI